MAHEIKSGKLEIKKVFEQWYRIPEYQRPYVWEDSQVIELLEDISNSAKNNKDSEYFLGSIVYQTVKKRQNDLEFEENDLLDGQQRLTTLSLIMAVIRDMEKGKNQERYEICQQSLYQKEKRDDNIPERLRIVFDIRNEVRDFVNNYIKTEGKTLSDDIKELSKTSEDISIKNMSKAILNIKNYFEENNNINEFFPYLRNKVLMIYVASENLEDAFRMFTILNNRGMKLRNSDILKAENLSKIKNRAKVIEYAKLWENIENEFGEDFDEFISHIRTILAKDKALKNLLDEFEEKIYDKGILKKGEDTFELIKKFYNHYNELFEKDNYDLTNSYEFNNLISVMDAVAPSKIWIPVLLKYFDKFGKMELFVFFKKLENKFSYDWINQATPTKRIENMNSIIKKIEESKTPQELMSTEVFKIDTENLISLISGSIYDRPYGKYLLYKLDYIFGSSGQNLKVPKEISVEHILPQNPKADSEWIKDFNDTERLEWTDKIGNLVLISRRKNASQSNSDYIDKKAKYFKKNIESFPNVLRVIQNERWTMKKLTDNQNIVISKLKEYYSN